MLIQFWVLGLTTTALFLNLYNLALSQVLTDQVVCLDKLTRASCTSEQLLIV